MPRRNAHRLQNTVGLLTSMNRPWDSTDEARVSEEAPEEPGGSQLRPLLSMLTAAFVMSLASIKSLFPEAWF